MWDFLKAMAPWLGHGLVLIISLATGIAANKLTAPAKPEAALVIPAADKDKTAPVTERAFVIAFETFGKRFDMLDGTAGLCVAEIQALRAERTDKVPAKAPAAVIKARPKPKDTGIMTLFGVGSK